MDDIFIPMKTCKDCNETKVVPGNFCVNWRGWVDTYCRKCRNQRSKNLNRKKKDKAKVA